MLKIRLKRMGKKGEPHYRVVVVESSKKRSSDAVDYLGYYNPRTNPSTFDVNKEKTLDWMKKGAQPTETVAQYLVKLGLLKSLKKGSKKSAGRKPKKQNQS